jgi:hypothetical protein
MLPCFVANHCPEYGYTQAQETQHDRKNDTHERGHNYVLRSTLCFALPVTSDRSWRSLLNCCNRSPKMQATPGPKIITATRFRGGKPSSNGAVIPFTTIMKADQVQFASPRAANEIHWLLHHAGRGCRWHWWHWWLYIWDRWIGLLAVMHSPPSRVFLQQSGLSLCFLFNLTAHCSIIVHFIQICGLIAQYLTYVMPCDMVAHQPAMSALPIPIILIQLAGWFRKN